LLLRDIRDQVVTLTLNQPQRYNPLSGDTLAEMQAALDEIAQDESIRVVIIAATGKAFSAGHDLKEVRANDDAEYIQTLFDRCARVMNTINQLPQPVIAQVNGIATAAGCQLVAACDLAVASEDARFAVSGIKYGLFCSSPAVPLSRNLSRKRAMRMLLTGDFIDAPTAVDFGLINEAVPADELESATRELAAKIVAKSAHAIRIGKDMFYRQLEMDLSEALFYGARRMACNMDSHDAREGFDAFLQKRQPTWKHE
jgi:enoyl-CoA hydratase/carnithine racemase